MGHHKRKRPKNRRAGCLMCKPHKANGVDRRTSQELNAEVQQFEEESDWWEEKEWREYWTARGYPDFEW